MPGDTVATAFVGVAAFSPLVFAAEIQPIDLSSGSALLGALAGGGFSVWYGWYITTTTLPKLIGYFREELAIERAARAADAKLLAEKLDALIHREHQ
jgi:hypothetical protein